MIAESWAALSVAMKILWAITIFASLVFVVQSVMTFLGADAGDMDGGMDADSPMDALDADAGASGSNLYTFRNLINFLLGFGWTSILLHDSVKSPVLLYIIAAMVGVGLVAIVMYIFKWLNGMQQSGTIDVRKAAVGCEGTVYLTIPGERKGEGKVQITINGAVREYTAQTDDDTIITGTPIKVVEVIGESTLVVARLDSLII
ncbi:MAG: hypothetical protein ACI4AE_00560 [Candidatus Cryptobacteroides sp.]